jgi:RNA polymerase sigma-70 factor (ECF subfamily)
MMHSDDAQLVESVCHGETSAAVELVDKFYKRVYAFLRRLCGSDADASDLTQRTFGRVWQGLSGFEGRASLNSWIHSIAYRLFLDWRRSQGRIEARPDEWWNTHPALEPGPDELLCRRDMATVLFSRVEMLDPGLRETVHLHYYQHLTLQETADAMGIAASTVKYRLRQALDRLKKSLELEQPSPAVRSATL